MIRLVCIVYIYIFRFELSVNQSFKVYVFRWMFLCGHSYFMQHCPRLPSTRLPPHKNCRQQARACIANKIIIIIISSAYFATRTPPYIHIIYYYVWGIYAWTPISCIDGRSHIKKIVWGKTHIHEYVTCRFCMPFNNMR